jgi:hypothetical protein
MSLSAQGSGDWRTRMMTIEDRLEARHRWIFYSGGGVVVLPSMRLGKPPYTPLRLFLFFQKYI